MVKIGMQLRANLEGVTGLKADGEDFRWYLKLKCLGCGEVPDHWQYVTLAESHPVKGGRGEASCVIKCKLCSRENSIDILAESITPYDIEDSQSNRSKTVVAFDCRGLEPVDFSPRCGWVAKGHQPGSEDGEGDREPGETGTVFNEIDLTDKEWADFDEASNLATLISDLEFSFVKLK